MTGIPESQVIEIWQKRLSGDRRLTADSGEAIEVIYPGRRNDDRGADFRDATILTGSSTIRGSIEIHARTGDWRAHRHHLDPFYNQVVLHVAMTDNTGTGTVSENGKSIPTVVLDEGSRETHAAGTIAIKCLPCSGSAGGGTPPDLAVFIEHAGAVRFREKAAAFSAGAAADAGQCLYQGLMGALGYARNKLPFIELSHRVPLATIESGFKDTISREEYIAGLQARLIGSAGLLPSQRPHRQGVTDEWTEKLERRWSDFDRSRAMSYTDWRLFKVRPGNFPVRRLAGMSHLLYRYRKTGLLEELVRVIREMPEGKGHSPEKALTASDRSYWENHFDFGAGFSQSTPVLIGGGRAAEMVVNVLLPFALAWSQIKALPELADKASRLYRSYPRLETNSVERHMMRQLGLKSSLVNSACRQQGLLHIYHTLCAQGKCQECSIGKIPSTKHQIPNKSQ